MQKNTLLKKVYSLAATAVLFTSSYLPLASTIAPKALAAPSSQGGLTITNSVDKTQADRGDILSYSVSVKNTGSANQTNVIVWFNPLNLASWVAGSGTYTRVWTGETKTLPDNFVSTGGNFQTIPVGGELIFKFKTKVADNANNGNVVWLVASAKSDQVPTSVQANASTGIVLANPGLCAEKTADKTTVTVGDTVTYTIKACNNGNVVLHDVNIYDRLDSRLTYVPGSSTYTLNGQTQTIADSWLTDRFNAGTLNPGQHGLLKFQVKINNTAKNGDEIQNVGQLNSVETNKWLQCAVIIKVVVEEKPEVKEKGFLKIFKFEDFNGNGVYNTPNEQGVPGFSFHIKGPNTDVTVTTGAGGVWLSGELTPGSYTITELHKDGWTATTDTTVTVTVKNGELTEVRFGNKQAGQVLPDTGPGLALLGLLGITPLGIAIRKLKKRI